MFEKLKFLMGFEDVEDEDEAPVESKPAIREPRRLDAPIATTFPSPRESKVVSMPQGSVSKSDLKLMLIEPKGFDECPRLVDNLKAKKPIIVNLEKIDRDTARKIFDFLSGAIYALNGDVQRVSANIFVFAPENVDVDAAKESKSSDLKNPWG